MGGVQFDKESAGRIAKVVQRVEQGVHGSTYREPRRTPQILGGPDGILITPTYETLPAYGVVAIGAGYHEKGEEVPYFARAPFGTNEPDYFGEYRRLAVNGSAAIELDAFGRGFLPHETPRPALYDTDTIGTGTLKTGEAWGPTPHDSSETHRYILHRGLPGFMAVGYRTYGDDDLLLVIRDTATSLFWCKATDDWTEPAYGGEDAYVAVYLSADSSGDYVYDSVQLEPTIACEIALPRCGTDKDPNIKSGDIFPYRFAAFSRQHDQIPWVAAHCYLDDKIGTVKMWIGDVADIPQGWRVYAALDGKFTKGDNSGALESGTFGTTGSDYAFAEVRFIERFE